MPKTHHLTVTNPSDAYTVFSEAFVDGHETTTVVDGKTVTGVVTAMFLPVVDSGEETWQVEIEEAKDG